MARLMIFRKNSSNNYQFHLVRESVAQLSLQWGNFGNFTFQCQHKVLTEREHFEVLQNDIVGAYLLNERLSIPLVGTSSETNLTIYHDKWLTGAGYLEHQPSLVLHVYANIGELLK